MPDDSIADASLDTTEADAANPDRVCAVCGAPVSESEWHPVESEIDENGEVRLYLFCSADCKHEWSPNTDADTTTPDN